MKFRVLEKKGISNEEFIEICNSGLSINNILNKINIHKETFKKYAIKLNCYQHLLITKVNTKLRFSLDKWNNNEHIDIARSSLRIHLFKILPLKCNSCGLEEWLNNKIPLELNHINGNGYDNRKSNIELLCPNCHALTDTYRGKNRVKNEKSYKRNRKEYLNKRSKELFEKQIEPKLDLIKNSNIDFKSRGWRLKLAELLKVSPQRCGLIIEKYVPEVWNNCFRHKDRK